MGLKRDYILCSVDGLAITKTFDSDDEAIQAAEQLAKAAGHSGRVEVWDRETDTLVKDFEV